MDSTQAKLETEAGEEGTTLTLQEGVWAGWREKGDYSRVSHKDLGVGPVCNLYLEHRADRKTSVAYPSSLSKETKP